LVLELELELELAVRALEVGGVWSGKGWGVSE